MEEAMGKRGPKKGEGGRPAEGPFVERLPMVMLPKGSLDHLKKQAAEQGISLAALARKKLGCVKPRPKGEAES